MAGTLTFFAGTPQWASTLAGQLSAMSRGPWLLGAVLCASAMAHTPLQMQGDSDPGLAPVVLPLADVAARVTRPLLVTNGVVATIRELAFEDGGARRYELTIRMRDGTLRVSNETGNASWRAGDAIRLIGSPVS